MLENEDVLKGEFSKRVFRRALDLLFEYRPRVKTIMVPASSGKIFIPLPNEYEIKSPMDIYGVYPLQTGLGFPVAYPRALGIYGIAGLGALSTAMAALSALRSIYQAFGLFPTWEIFEAQGGFYILTHPPVSEQVAIIFRYSFADSTDFFTKSQTELGIEGVEREWLRRYLTVFMKKFLGRIRSRFGETLPVGPLDLTQDGSVLLDEAKSDEAVLLDELLAISPGPLPMWG